MNALQACLYWGLYMLHATEIGCECVQLTCCVPQQAKVAGCAVEDAQDDNTDEDSIEHELMNIDWRCAQIPAVVSEPHKTGLFIVKRLSSMMSRMFCCISERCRR